MLYLICIHISVISATSYCQDIQLNYVYKIYQCIKYQYINYINITLVCEDLENIYKKNKKRKKIIKMKKEKKCR